MADKHIAGLIVQLQMERDRLRAENEQLREHHKIAVDSWTLEAQTVKQLEDEAAAIRAENERLREALRCILGWRETDLPEGNRCARAVEYIEEVATAALRGEEE